MRCLLDTNVISALVAAKPNLRVVNWIDSLDPDDVYLSVITIGEIRKGIAKLPESKRKARLLTWLVDDLLLRFDGHILSLDVDVALTSGANSLGDWRGMGCCCLLLTLSSPPPHLRIIAVLRLAMKRTSK